MTETWPPTTPEHVLLTGWRPVPPAELLGYQARLGCAKLEGVEAVGVHIETQRKESLMVLRPAAEGTGELAARAVAPAGERDASHLEARRDLPPDRKAVSGLDEGRIAAGAAR